MTKPMKKPEFLLPFAQTFTRSLSEIYDSIPFRSPDHVGDESFPALTAPTTWSDEAVEAMKDAAFPSVPAELQTQEENTVPSWLWRHKARSTKHDTEADLRKIFDRSVGSAVAKAWKLSLFTNERHARIFFDEARYALLHRHIGIAPHIVASWGLNWAYGVKESPVVTAAVQPRVTREKTINLSNIEIDSALSSRRDAPLWKKLFAVSSNERSTVKLRLQDIASDWRSTAVEPARAAIDVLVLRHNDGSLNIDALRQAARILTILLDLQDRSDVTITVVNLAPLLLALGLSYDSDAARAMAASIAALITAECVATSAELAALRGPSEEFVSDRDAIMRSLRNHRRASHGDHNDYEKLSVLPAPLTLKNCPDLALTAEVQRRWDEAVLRAQAFGLRAVQATDFTPYPLISVLMSCASQGLEPLEKLTVLAADHESINSVVAHPAVSEALARLDYPRSICRGVVDHIAGTHSLRKGPAINHASLRSRGLTESALEIIETYIPCVDTLKLAITPWVVGIDFCRNQLKIPARALQSPHFDLLKHLGFSEDDIAAANSHCYGSGTVRNAKILHLRHRVLFACGKEVSSEARMRMASSVQSFISGNTGTTVFLSPKQSAQSGAAITLTAWKAGLKSLTLVFDSSIQLRLVPSVAKGERRIKVLSESQARSFTTPKRRLQSSKATTAPDTKRPKASHKLH